MDRAKVAIKSAKRFASLCKQKYYRVRNRRIRATVFSERNGSPSAYIDRPNISAVIQLFNKRDHILPIMQALENSGVEEIIFVDDGSSDGAIDVLMSLMCRKNYFIIRSNDLFEVRTYDRAIDFARSDIVVLLQDDDLPPADPRWIERALRCFANDPKLAILGGRNGLSLKAGPEYDAGISYDGIRMVSADEPMRLVDAVNRAPMFVRRAAFRALGGIDPIFAPFQCDDVDLCLRAWKAGYRVGLIHTDFKRDIGVGGMRMYNTERIGDQAKKNWRIISDRYAEDIKRQKFVLFQKLAQDQDGCKSA